MFHIIDQDNDNHISLEELRAFVIGLQFDDIDLDTEEATTAAARIMGEFDSSGDNQLDAEEFYEGLSAWLCQSNGVIPSGQGSTNFFDKFHHVFYQESELHPLKQLTWNVNSYFLS